MSACIRVRSVERDTVGRRRSCCHAMHVGLIIKSRWEARCEVVTVAGEIDASTAAPLLAEFDALIEAGGAYVVVDMSAVSFCGSTGLTVLIVTHKRLAADGGWLRVAAPTQQVRKAIELTGLNDVVATYPDVASAMAAVEAGI